MAQSGDELRDFILLEVVTAGSEGIAIKNLFERVDDALGFKGYDINEAWKNLLARNDVVFLDPQGAIGIRKHSLEEVLDSEFSREKVKIVRILPSANPNAAPLERRGRPSDPTKPTRMRGFDRPSQTVNQLLGPNGGLPKRKGRPPGRKDAVKRASQSLDLQHTEVDDTPLPAKRRGRLPRSLIDAAAQEPANTAVMADDDHAMGRGRRSRPRIRKIGGTPIIHTRNSLLIEAQTRLDERKAAAKRPGRGRAQVPREAEYTSWEELQREGGVPGAYLNEKISDARRELFEEADKMLKERDQSFEERKASYMYLKVDSMVMTFKSESLKDKHWLESRKGASLGSLQSTTSNTPVDNLNGSSRSRKRRKVDTDPSLVESATEGRVSIENGLTVTSKSHEAAETFSFLSITDLGTGPISKDTTCPDSHQQTHEPDAATATVSLNIQDQDQSQVALPSSANVVSTPQTPASAIAGVNQDSSSKKNKSGKKVQLPVDSDGNLIKERRGRPLKVWKKSEAQESNPFSGFTQPSAHDLIPEIPNHNYISSDPPDIPQAQGSAAQHTPIDSSGIDSAAIVTNNEMQGSSINASGTSSQFQRSLNGTPQSRIQSLSFSKYFSPGNSFTQSSGSYKSPYESPSVDVRPSGPSSTLAVPSSQVKTVGSAVPRISPSSDIYIGSGPVLADPSSGGHTRSPNSALNAGRYPNGNMISEDVSLQSDMVNGQGLLSPPVPVTPPVQFLSPRTETNPFAKQKVHKAPKEPPKPKEPKVPQPRKPPKDPVAAEKARATKEAFERRIAKKNTAEAALLSAESIAVPRDVLRLSSIYKEAVGNLILSADKNVVEFFGLDQFPPQVPFFVLPISGVHGNPVTSRPGHDPMTLKITSRENNENIFHFFQFSKSAEALEAAGNFRSKLATAVVSFQVQSSAGLDQVNFEASKPWHCTKCDKRFKNDIGLKYHIEKSQSSCNPDWDPSTIVPKRGPPPTNKKKPKLDRKEKKPPDGNVSDSQDSVMEWAEKVVNSKPQKRAPIEGFAGRKFVNLPHEVMLLEELGRDAASIENQAPKTALDLSSVENFRQLTLNIVRQNGGIFPGDKALWLATVALWLRSEGPSLEFLPESKYSRQACDDLLASRELFKIEHTFRAKGSRKGTRPFVHTPGFDLASPSVDFTKTKIAEAHTDYYVPLEYVLPKEIADRVQKTARGRSAVTFEESAIKMPAGKDVYYYDDESDYEEGDIPMRLERRISSASSNLSTDVLPAPRARAPSFTLVSDEDDNRQPGTTGRPLKIPSRNQEWKDSAGRVLKERWAAAHSLGLRTLKKDAVRGTPAPKATYVPWSKHYNDHLSSHGWQPFVASFPDPNTGAWADGPIKRKHRSYRTKNTRHRGPEPITIMQEGSGAWSQRTFGHGVEPIFARPGRITSKEKAEEITNYYQRLLDGGFRPVVLPSKSTAGNLDIDLQPRDPSRLPQRPCGDLLPSIEPGVGMYVDMYANIPNEYVATQSSNERRESSTPMSGRDHYDEYGPRISRATGIRIPSYPLKHFTLSDDDSDGVGEVDFQRVETRRMTRTSRRAAEASVQLPYNEQLELEVVPRKQNPGLETVPKAFGIEGYSLAAEFELGSEYSPKHNSLEFIKPELTYNHCTLGEGSWVSSEWYIPLPKNVRIRFRQNRTMENLLYDDLKSDEDEELPSKPRAKRRKVGEKGAIVDPKFKTMRIQTGAITDFQGLVKDANEARRRFDVEVSEYKVGTRRDDGKRFEAKMTAQVQQRLIATIIAVKVIAGGIDGFIDWVVIVTMFPEFSMGRLARYWPSLRESHGQVIERITEDFQAAFPTAYKNGEVPAMNYDHLLDYDWSAVIDWMYANIDVTLDKKSIVLPGSRKGINEKFHIRPPEDISGKLREQTFSRFTPLIKKLEIWAGVGHVIPMKSRKALQNENTNDLDGLMIARSIVRATAITPEEYWNQRVAKERLEGLGVNYLQDALAALQSEKVIVHVKKGRATPGRSYEATFLFGQKLNRNIPAQQFIDALNFKEHLDTLHAKDINTRIRLERNCNEGTIMCITSLQAVGQLKLEAKNVPGDKMYGLTGDDQDVRRIPREKLYFDLDLLFTSLYVPNNRISVLNTLPRTRPARPDGPEIPIWMSITGRLLPKMWKDVFSTVSQTMALRSGISTKGLRETFRPSLEEWEIKMLLRWGEELGIFQRLSKRIDGWTVGEDWWLGVAWLEKNM